MKKIRLIGYVLAFGWLFACVGCGLFRNTTRHREMAHSETRKSIQRVSDSVTTHTENKVDFAVLETSRVSEAAIGFIAEGNVIIHPDGTVAADRVRGAANQIASHTSTHVDESHQQQQSVQTVAGISEIRESKVYETAAIEKQVQPNSTVYIIMLVMGVAIAAISWCQLSRRR